VVVAKAASILQASGHGPVKLKRWSAIQRESKLFFSTFLALRNIPFIDGLGAPIKIPNLNFTHVPFPPIFIIKVK